MGANRQHVGGFPGALHPGGYGAESLPGSEGPAGSRPHNLLSPRRASLMQEPVLVLNATYEPIKRDGCAARDGVDAEGCGPSGRNAQRGSAFRGALRIKAWHASGVLSSQV